MEKRIATLMAATTFALGLGIGKSWNMHTVASTSDARNVPTQVALPAGHPAVAERSLADAIRTTMQARRAAPLADAPVTGSAAASATSSAAASLAQADALRRERRFQAAAEVYRRVAAAGGMTADAWADYADAVASATSSLRGEPAKALDAALALEPQHPKALWLKASLEHEQHQYRDAVRTWQSLLAVVPANSSDASIIRANIAEASRLASGRS